MKVIVVCAAGIVSGKEVMTFNRMLGLKSRGHEVFCLMSSWGSKEFENMLADAGIPVARIRAGFISKTLTWPAIRMTLYQAICLPWLWMAYNRWLRTFQPDVVIHTNFHHIFLLLAALGKAPQVFYVHDYFAPSKFMKRLFSRFNRRMQLYIGVSKFICESLPSLGVDEHKIKLVYNGIAVPPGTSHSPDVDVVIGIVGQIRPWKGHAVLLSALAKISNEKWRLSVIGDGSGEYVQHLKELSANLGISDRVEFKGKVSGLNQIYGGLDIVCVPSLVAESFGLAAGEPGFFGIPVVCTSVGALPEVVLDKHSGLVVPPNDMAALASALKRLLANKEERVRLGKNAELFVKKSFSMDSTNASFERNLKDLIS